MRDSRGISPVVGSLILIAVVLILSTVVWVSVQGLLTPVETAPKAGFAAAEKKLPPGTSIEHRFGDEIQTENIRVKGGIVLNDVGQTWDTPEQLVVYPLGTDEIKVIWEGERRSTTLYSTKSRLPPISYEVVNSSKQEYGPNVTLDGVLDNGQAKFERNTTLTNRVTASGQIQAEGPNSTFYRGIVSKNGKIELDEKNITVYGRVRAPNEIKIGEDNTVKGIIEVSGANDGNSNQITIEKRTEVTGIIRTNGTDTQVQLKENVSVNGRIITNGTDSKVQLNENVSVDGRINTNGSADLGQKGITVSGDVVAGKDVKLGQDNVVGGDVIAGTIAGDDDDAGVEVGQDTTVVGGVKVINNNDGGDGVELKQGSSIGGNVIANDGFGDSSVQIKKNVTVGGRVNTTGEVKIKEQASVAGRVVGKRVTVGKNAQVGGNIRSVSAGNSVTIGESANVDGTVITPSSVTIKTKAYTRGVMIDSTTDASLTVEQDGVVLGDVSVTTSSDTAVTVKASGKVIGDIDANSKVILEDNVVVDGTVSAPKLVCGEDVVINGETCTA